MSTEGFTGTTTRRQTLLALALSLVTARTAFGRGRALLGGRLSLRAPWPVGSFDPHRLDDAASLFFGPCLFDSLFGIDASGMPVPALAETLPDGVADGTRVALRRGMRFASGKPVTSRDVVASVARARRYGAHAWLDALGPVKMAGPSAIHVGLRNRSIVARALASPLAAVVPEGFAPERPDGTGPFAAEHEGTTLILMRNRFAATGPAYLDAVSVAPAPDLAASLRAFESGEDDLGWLGLGLHEPRRGAVPFDAGALGWAVLRTGDQAGRWSLPGVAERLADGIDPARLAQLGATSDRAPLQDLGWGGPPVPLLVRDDSPWLIELARVVAAALSQPEHDVTARTVPVAELVSLRTSRAYSLALDLVRPFDRTPLGASVALASADDPERGAELARHPPLGSADPRVLCRTLRLGILADVHLQGGRMSDLVLPRGADGVGVDFGAIIHPRTGS